MSPASIAAGRETGLPSRAPRVGADFVPKDDYFGVPRQAFGEHRLPLGIGPLRFELTGLSAGQQAQLAVRFRPFDREPDGRCAPDLTIRFQRAGVPQFLSKPRRDVEIYRMGRRSEGTRHAVWSYEFAGLADVAEHRAELALLEPEGPDFERGTENFLRVLTALYILGRGGLLVHGAGVVKGGRTHVFFGPSGCGKTTVTDLSPDDLVLSDDLTLIVPHEGRYVASGIPFGMAHHRVPRTSGGFPIAGLHRLVQSTDLRREPLSRAQALAELAACLPFAMQAPGSASRALLVAADVVAAVPVDRLLFRRDPGFWEILN